MTHRQRAAMALERKQPDFVPTFELVFHETERDFQGRTFYGAPDQPDTTGVSYEQQVAYNAQLYVDLARHFEHSILFLSTLTIPEGAPGDNHRFTQAVIDHLRAIRELSGDEYMLMAHGDATFAIPDGSGMMELISRITEDPDGLKKEAERRLKEMLKDSKEMMDAGLDGFILCSDYAFNNGPFLSPAMFEEFVTPYLRENIAAQRAMGAYTIKHTDGNIMPIIDQMVDCQPHALHSLDPMAGVDIKQVKKDYSDRIALCGNVHCAHMQSGTPEEIRESAEYCMENAKPGGGYIFCTSNCVFRGMPMESYDLIHKIWKERRDYA
jgi:uroporphyrinogen decarboxylase